MPSRKALHRGASRPCVERETAQCAAQKNRRRRRSAQSIGFVPTTPTRPRRQVAEPEDCIGFWDGEEWCDDSGAWVGSDG